MTKFARKKIHFFLPQNRHFRTKNFFFNSKKMESWMFCATETITAKKNYWIKKKNFSYEFLRIRKNWSFFVRIRRKFVRIRKNSYQFRNFLRIRTKIDENLKKCLFWGKKNGFFFSCEFCQFSQSKYEFVRKEGTGFTYKNGPSYNFVNIR